MVRRSSTVSYILGVLVTFAPVTIHASQTLDVVGAIGETTSVADGSAVVLSPDDQFVYAVDASKSSISVFSWDPLAVDLTVVQYLENGVGGADALAGASGVAISPDGDHVYVASSDDDALVAFARDAGSGELSLIEAETDGSGGVNGLDGAFRIAVSPDGDHVYVAARNDNAVVAFARDPVSGELDFVEAEIDGVGGVNGIDGTEWLDVSPDGAHVYVTGRDDGAVAVFARDAVTGALAFVEAEINGVGGVTGLALASSVEVSPDGAHVYVGGLIGGFPSTLVRFSRHAGTGALTYVSTTTLGSLFTGTPAQIAMSPDGLFLYAGDRSEGKGSLHVFSRNPTTGALAFLPSEEHVQTIGLALVSTGDWILGAGQGLAVFERDAVTGLVEYVARHYEPTICSFTTASCGGAVSSNGAHVYFVAREAVFAYERDDTTGALTFLQALYDDLDGVEGLRGAGHAALSPDGLHLYVSGGSYSSFDGGPDHAVVLFERNPLTGTLSFVEAYFDGSGGVDGLEGAHRIVVSPDGAHVYVATLEEGAITSFARDPVTGSLTLVEVETAGQGTHGSAQDRWLAVSPDGAHVYANACCDPVGQIVRYARDAGTGELALLGATTIDGDVTNTQDGALSPDGKHLYAIVTAFEDSQLLVFARDPATGSLALVETETNQVDGVILPGLFRANLAVAPDGRSVLVGKSALSAFARDVVTGQLSFIEQQGGAPLTQSNGAFLVSSDSAHVYAALVGEPIMAWGFGCAPEPLAGCRTAEKTNLQIADVAKDKADKIKWSLTGVEATTSVEFDPMTENHYAGCIYDESTPTPTLVASLLAAADSDCDPKPPLKPKPCWTNRGKVFQYSDKMGTPDGVSLLQLTHTPKVRIKLQASEHDVGFVGPPPLPLGLPVRAQLQAASGLCWEAVYPAAQKSTAELFKAKSG